jgi:SAM-dependent methyltransferase
MDPGPRQVQTCHVSGDLGAELTASSSSDLPGASDLVWEWRTFSSEWIARSEAKADAAREGVLEAWMLDVVGEVEGLDIIDLGCGEGRFCRMLAEKGARTLGVDLQPAFIDYAKNRAGPAERYSVGDIQSLREVPDGLLDLAVSYISLVDGLINRRRSRRRSASYSGSTSRSRLPPSSPESPGTRICSGYRSSLSTTW